MSTDDRLTMALWRLEQERELEAQRERERIARVFREREMAERLREACDL